jgi:hypothetical protein
MLLRRLSASGEEVVRVVIPLWHNRTLLEKFWHNRTLLEKCRKVPKSAGKVSTFLPKFQN